MSYNEDTETAKVGHEAEVYVKKLFDNWELGKYFDGFKDYDAMSLRLKLLDKSSSLYKELFNVTVAMGIDAQVILNLGYAINIDVKNFPKHHKFEFEMLKELGTKGVLFNTNINKLIFASPSEQVIHIVDRQIVHDYVMKEKYLGFSLKPGETSHYIEPDEYKSVNDITFGQIHKGSKYKNELWAVMGYFQLKRLNAITTIAFNKVVETKLISTIIESYEEPS